MRILLTLVAFSCLSLSAAESTEPTRPRNIVFILADDLGYGELGCYGQTKIKTPNIDRLAAEGTRFTQHYSGAPVCAPARYVLLTGKHLGHAEIRGNRQAKVSFPEFKEGQHPIARETVTLAQTLRKAGFTTGAMGKWGLGPVGSSGDPNLQGFDLFFGYNCQAEAHSYYPSHLWRNAVRVPLNEKPIPGHGTQPEGEVRMEKWTGKVHASTVIVEEAVEFIEKNKGKPFFLYLPLTEPHAALQPPIAAVDAYPKEWDPIPYRGENGYTPHPRPRAAYAAIISELDRHVGRVRTALEQAGILDDTLIVFTSDNGTTHGPFAKKDAKQTTNTFGIGGVDATFFNSVAGLRGLKGSVYEGGLRVPLIVRWPNGVKAGTVNETPSYFADWYPTLCTATGVAIPEGLDGQNIWPAIKGGALGAPRIPMIWVYPEYGGQVAVRMGNLKIVRRNLLSKVPGNWEVYAITSDPYETQDIAAQNAPAIAMARQILRAQTQPNALFPLEWDK
jgi:arylsulfatase A-like enzyme